MKFLISLSVGVNTVTNRLLQKKIGIVHIALGGEYLVSWTICSWKKISVFLISTAMMKVVVLRKMGLKYHSRILLQQRKKTRKSDSKA